MEQGLSAAQKYAELEANGLERPRCACHGEPKRWNKEDDRLSGGYWSCAERHRQKQREYVRTNPDKMRESHRRYRKANPEKRAAGRAARMFADGMYLGTCRFTQTEVGAMLNGTSD